VLGVDNDYENMEVIKQHESEVIEAPPHYENAEMCRNGNYDRSVSTETTDSQSDGVVRSNVMHASHVHSKALVVVSGGEGHVNWNSNKEKDVKCDDTCLILWQCPP
jgi:hypothetical protein